MTAFRFSANTGYLWKDLPFLDRIRQAAQHDDSCSAAKYCAGCTVIEGTAVTIRRQDLTVFV